MEEGRREGRREQVGRVGYWKEKREWREENESDQNVRNR